MSVISFLEKHARDNVWCTPDQDSQYTFQPHRVSFATGALRNITIGQESYSLPNTTDRFHVFQLGQMPADFLRITAGTGIWRHVSSVCQSEKLVVDLYTTNGVQYPRSQSWFLITPNKNVIIAVQAQPRIQPDLGTAPLFVRFYSSAFFTANRRLDDGISYSIYVYGMTIRATADIATIAQLYNDARALQGYATATVNGYIVNTITSNNTHTGDVVEFIYDSTVGHVVDVALSSLATFTSTLDGKQKYLLSFKQALNVKDRSHLTPTPLTEENIFFFDDNDIQLYRTVSLNSEKGVLYHRNQVDAVRMLTHRDYALPVTYINAYVDNAGVFATSADVRVRLLLRQGGYERQLIDDASRIRTLYTLNEPGRPVVPGIDGVASVMQGLEATLPEWQAAHLENADYPRVMRRYDQYITDNNIVGAYGYHAIAKAYGEVAHRIVPANGQWDDANTDHYIDLPVGAQHSCTVFIYTTDVETPDRSRGKLTNFYYSQDATRFHIPADAWDGGRIPVMAEVFIGDTGDLSLSIGKAIYTVPTPNEFRCYKCPIGAYGPTWEWVDVTGTGDYTVTHNANGTDTVAFTVDTQFYCTAVKTTERFLWYGIQFNANESLLRFSVDASFDYNGTTVTDVLRLPPGKLEIFAEGYKLIEGLDYYVRYPEVVISAARAFELVPTGVGHVNLMVRASGFCNPQMQRDARQEAGFVVNGVISVDTRFEARKSKVHRLFVDGQLVDQDYIRANSGQLQIQEDVGSHFVVSPTLTGLPFVFEDAIVPLPGLGDGRDALAMRETALDLDQRISDFFTAKYPQPLPVTPDVAAAPYRLFSPFYFKILSDLISGLIPTSAYDPAPTDTALKATLQPYEYLLPYDPCRKRDAWWLPNVVILGHPLANMNITIKQWAFMVRVDQIYLFNTINTNANVSIVG
jgi:hypothetical protein